MFINTDDVLTDMDPDNNIAQNLMDSCQCAQVHIATYFICARFGPYIARR